MDRVRGEGPDRRAVTVMLGHPVPRSAQVCPTTATRHAEPTGINRCYNLESGTAGSTPTLTWYHIDFISDLLLASVTLGLITAMD